MLNILDAITPTNILPYCILGVATFAEGPITLLAAGAGIAVGKLLPLPAYLSIVIGNLSADLAWYSLGRFGKPEWIERITRKFGINPRIIRQVSKGVQKYAPRLVFLSKMTVGFPIPTLIAVGLNRVTVKRWILPLVLGELIKSALLVTVGFLFAQGIEQTYGVVRIVLWSLTAMIIAVLFIYLKFHKKSNLTSMVN
jgi:membrane protein DedA with SNARE-associated domain